MFNNFFMQFINNFSFQKRSLKYNTNFPFGYWVFKLDNTGRNIDEVLRALEATQNIVKTPCNWQPGEAML